VGVLEPVKRLFCVRCGVALNSGHARYLWVGYGERGAADFGKPGNLLFGRKREQSEDVFCGPCGDQWREREERFRLGEGLSSFDRGVVRD
jgi:hypothetical protein